MNTLDVDSHDPASYAGRSLTEDDKLELLTCTWKIRANFEFPVTFGRFNPNWLAKRPWLRYSIKTDSVYCIPCVCFSGTSDSPFVSTGYRNWKKALGKKIAILSSISLVKITKLLRNEQLYFCSKHINLEQTLVLC